MCFFDTDKAHVKKAIACIRLRKSVKPSPDLRMNDDDRVVLGRDYYTTVCEVYAQFY